MNRHLIGVLSSVCLAATTFGQSPEIDKGRIASLVANAAQDDACPGVVVGVIKDGELVFRVAKGCRRFDEPENLISVDDKLHLGSCTKAMTATLVGMLVDDGKLSWDQTIGESLPTLAKDIDSQYQKLTLWHVVTHRAAMQVKNAISWRMNGGVGTHENRMAIAKASLTEMPQSLKPGEYNYSNLGFVVAALFAEEATGEVWEDLITEKLFKQLKMASAGFGPPDTQLDSTQPWGHVSSNGKLYPLGIDNAESMAPAGRVHCSIEDWARFIKLHLDLESKRHQLLLPSTIKRLHTPFEGAGRKYAAGWVIEGGSGTGARLWHNGSNTLWYCCVRALPEQDLAVMVVTNSGTPIAQKIVEGLNRSVLELFADKQ